MQMRTLLPSDLDLICHHRERMFIEAGRDLQSLHSMAPAFRTWLTPRLQDGSYFGFFLLSDAAEATDDTVVAGIGLMAIDWPPHPAHPLQDKRGYVLNLYVEPGWRQRGLATRLMQSAEQEFSRRGLQYAILHATSMGRPLYESGGWRASTEMTKQLG